VNLISVRDQAGKVERFISWAAAYDTHLVDGAEGCEEPEAPLFQLTLDIAPQMLASLGRGVAR
jgi:hypothetical protein